MSDTQAMNTATSHRVKLGRTGLQVSPICYGTWQLSPRFWGDVPEADAMEAIHRAFDLGVNFYDTADAYGDGLAEEVLGRAVAELPRDQIVIATKAYHHIYEDGHRHGDLSHDYILAECEASLRRLNLDYLDLYQCHSFDVLAHPAEIAQAMDTLVKQGKIRHYGTSNWTAEQMRMGAGFGNFATCQPYYSLLRRGIEDDVLPYCLANNIGVLVFSPLHRGILTGKFKGDETFTDVRKNNADYQGERFKLICQRMEEVGRIAADLKLTTTQLVLAATLMHPAIHCTIVGIKNRAQIEEAVGAMGRRLTRDQWYKITALLNVPKA